MSDFLSLIRRIPSIISSFSFLLETNEVDASSSRAEGEMNLRDLHLDMAAADASAGARCATEKGVARKKMRILGVRKKKRD